MSEEKRLPHRVQLKRTKGYRIEPNTTICDRRGIYGNLYKIVKCSRNVFYNRFNYIIEKDGVAWSGLLSHESAIHRSITLLGMDIQEMEDVKRTEWLKPLLGKNLACWCSGTSACHTDVLFKWLEIEFGQEYEERVSYE